MLTVLAATLPDYMQAVARPYAMPVAQQAAGPTWKTEFRDDATLPNGHLKPKVTQNLYC